MKDKQGNIYKISYHCCYVVDGVMQDAVVDLAEPITGWKSLENLRKVLKEHHHTDRLTFLCTPQLIGYTKNGEEYIPQL